MTGETTDKLRLLGCEIVFFAYVMPDVVEFLLSCFIAVDKFPIAFSNGTIEVDARPLVAPYMRIVPYEATIF